MGIEGQASPRSGRERVAQGESASPGYATGHGANPQRGRQSHTQPPLSRGQDVFNRRKAVARYAGLRATPLAFPGLADSPWATCYRPLPGLLHPIVAEFRGLAIPLRTAPAENARIAVPTTQHLGGSQLVGAI